MIYSEIEVEKVINNVDLNALIQIIKKLIRNNKLNQAMEICKREEFEDNIAIQSQLITLLLKEGRIEEAKEICNREKFKGNVTIQSQLITILLKERKIKEAMKICEREKFRNNVPIQSRLIKILIRLGRIKEVKEICNREIFKDNALIQTQLIKILIKEGRIEEAKKICERDSLKDNLEIQAQLLSILSIEERSEETKAGARQSFIDIKKQIQDDSETIGDRFGDEISYIIENLKKQQDEKEEEVKKLEHIIKKPYSDIRARMQLVIYLNRYGMEKIAEQRLKNENQIYQEIYRLVLVANDRTDVDKKNLFQSESVQSLREQILKLGGDNEYADEIIDKAIKRGKEESQERE